MEIGQKSIDTILSEAIEIASEGERHAYLDEVCGDNEELRLEVEKLIADHFEAGDFLERPVRMLEATIDRPITEQPGDTIGPYKLLQQIGEGGMGVVYMAEQREPVERRVALKVIKPGMDTRQVVARFEAERQALAIMDHPNIAKVFDGGTTETGRPYFVMELIQGVPITEYCDQQRLTPRERLELFLPVCQAVQHAHQKGIIHRDIKPSNIMVATYDNQPLPKVIDFGVAKATGQRLTEKTMFTQFGQIVGTLEYMSPEQARMDDLDVDTRSDIYSLGVLLYELLTGDTPFDPKRLRSAAFDEMLRIIREDEPPRPSTRLSTSDTLPSVAANRQIDPQKLKTLVHGELDWIVMKALEKERDRRYETASGFVQDIERYLKDEPVDACPPSARYRFGKFARRNKQAMILAGAITVALVIGLVGTAWQAVRANREAKAAETALMAEAEQRTTAEQKADEADAVVNFLVNDLLGAASPENTLGRQITVEEVLAEAEKKIDTAFADQPVVEAAIRHTLGITYKNLGKYEPAERHLKRAAELRTKHLGAEHADTLSSRFHLATQLSYQGNYAEAQKLLEETLDVQRRVLGPEHPSTLGSMNSLAIAFYRQSNLEEAQKLLEETLDVQRRVLGSEHPSTLISMHNLADVFLKQTKFEESRKLHEETLEIRRRVLGPEHPDTLKSTNNLASVLKVHGKLAEAQKLHEETFDIKRLVLGPEHPTTLASMSNFAIVLRAQGKLAEAQKLQEETLEIQRRVLGPEHPSTLNSMSNLASLFKKQGKLDEANKLREEVLELRRHTLGPEHPRTVRAMEGLANDLQHQGKLEEARKLYDEIIELDLDNYYYILTYRGHTFWYLEDYENALADFEKAVQVEPDWFTANNELCWALATCPEVKFRDTRRATQLGEIAVKLAPSNYVSWFRLGAAYYVAGDYHAAVSALEKARELPDFNDWPLHGFYLAMVHWQLDQKEVALQWYQKAADWMREWPPMYQAAELLGIEIRDEDREATEEESSNDEEQSTELKTDP